MATFAEHLARTLLKALENGDLRSIEDVLSKGADPNLLLEPEGISAMHLFLGPDCSDSLTVILLLLNHGGNPNVRSCDGMTSLHVCAAWGKIDVMRVLLKYGGDPNLIDFDGNTVVGLALDNGHLEIIDLLHLHCDNICSPSTHTEVRLHVDAGGDRLAGKSYRAQMPSSTIRNSAEVKLADLNTAFVTAGSIPELEDASVEILSPTLRESVDRLENSSHNTLNVGYLSAISSELDSCRTYCTVDEFLFVDNRQNVALLEREYLLDSDCKYSGDNALSSHLSSSSVVSVAESLSSSIENLPEDVIRQKLKSFGEIPGPLTLSTRRVYLRRLHFLLKRGQQLMSASKSEAINSPQLSACLNGCVSVESYRNLEINFLNEFSQERLGYRGGVVKSCFNYFLLDPRVLQNLSQRVSSLTDSEALRTFVSAVFYIGKGQLARAYDHFYEAIRLSNASSVKVSEKVRRIQAIWESGFGVINLQCFQGMIAAEAFTREASIIDAIGKVNLTNERFGNYYGDVAKWLLRDKCKLGSVFLHRAFCIFLQEGERQIYPFNLAKPKPLCKAKKK